MGVLEYARVCADVCGCAHGWMWDEFSEYLLETWVLTSADFNTYPIRICFLVSFFYHLNAMTQMKKGLRLANFSHYFQALL